MRVNPDIDDAKTIYSMSTTAVGSPMLVSMDPAIQAPTEQMAALTLLVKSNLSSINLATSALSPNLATSTPIAVTVPTYILYCT